MLLHCPALALLALTQIAPTSPAQQRAAERRARREAARTEAPYKDTHLDVSRLNRGQGEAQPVSAKEPRFRRDGTPRAAGPGNRPPRRAIIGNQ